MISEKHIERINKVIKDMVFEFEGNIFTPDLSVKFEYQFAITGQRKMISVGEYYDYAFYDITILDVSDMLKKYLSIVLEIFYQNKLEGTMKERLEYWFKKVKVGGTMIIEDIQKLDTDTEKIDELCFKLGLSYEIIDLRNNKNRYDDVLLIFKKNDFNTPI